MTDLAADLRQACAGAAKGDKVVTIHLFGIRHAERLKGANLQNLAERAGNRRVILSPVLEPTVVSCLPWGLAHPPS
jgi:hypothetical protein